MYTICIYILGGGRGVRLVQQNSHTKLYHAIQKILCMINDSVKREVVLRDHASCNFNLSNSH